MPGIPVISRGGPNSYSPADNATVRGGRGVEGVAGGRIQEHSAGSVKFLGVALGDAIAPEDVVTASTTGPDGRPVVSYAIPATVVAVAESGDEVPVVYSANAAFGERLVCTANGAFAPAGANPDARTIVAKCTEKGGVVVATNPVGRARIL